MCFKITEHRVAIREKCTGCGACVSVCPVNAISFNCDGYPVIDDERCVNCNKCKMVCPLSLEIRNDGCIGYMGWNKDADVRSESSSGGAFSAIVEMWKGQEENFSVFATVFDMEQLAAVYKKVSYKEMSIVRKSKYVESRTGKIFREVKKTLENNEKCVFCGTPCHVAGLRQYLGKKYDNLLMMDFVCHGVPKLSFFREWIKRKGNIRNVVFRPHWGGWKNQAILYEYDSGHTELKFAEEDFYLWNFLNDRCIRGSCYECQFRGQHVSDITIADFWGIFNNKKRMAQFKKQSKNGISLLLINTEKGRKLSNDLDKNMEIYKLQEKEWHYALSSGNPLKNQELLEIHLTVKERVKIFLKHLAVLMIWRWKNGT